ncbi:MAG: glycerol-3-phosphate dehydrogenase [Candidatus Azotimanducaceae bacterium]
MSQNVHKTDVAILGGGIAGLWLLNLLTRTGYSAVLVERDQLGCGQTLASQGMIHGGVKYMLSGAPTGASETIADMPDRWRQCLIGEGSLDLRGVSILSDAYYMFSDQRITSKITTFFGSKATRGRIKSVKPEDYPPVFHHDAFKGTLYQLLDLVIDTGSLLRHLADQHPGLAIKGDARVERGEHGIDCLTLDNGRVLKANHYIFAAGSGNEELINQAGLPLTMQRRPLHQLMVTGDLPALYAHAVTMKSADKPRITFSTHPAPSSGHGGKNTWYLGGLLAETGVAREDIDQIEHAKRELSLLLPWINMEDCVFESLRIDRAEPGGAEGLRPDTPFVKRFGNTMVCWPTKLTLTPLMGDMVLSQLDDPTISTNANPSSSALMLGPAALVAPAPWEQSDAQTL